MNCIEPSQFLELILYSLQSHPDLRIRKNVKINARIFNKMIDELFNSGLSVRFGYSDFVDFIVTFDECFVYKASNLNIVYSEELLMQVRQYNEIHENNIKSLIMEVLWQDYVK